MAKSHKIIQSLNSGELSPLLDARIDQAKYTTGCRTMENAYPLIYGGAERRPGMQYIASQKDQSAKARVEGFEFSVDDTYVLQMENQVIRVLKNGAQVFTGTGTETLGLDNIVAHWLLNDNVATTAVLDDDGNTHDGVATTNTNNLHEAGKVGTGCFNFDSKYAVEVADSTDFSFGDGSNDSPFSIGAWIYVSDFEETARVIAKDDSGVGREWVFNISTDKSLALVLFDDSEGSSVKSQSDASLSRGWHFVVATYDGTGGASAADGIKLYVDTVIQDATTSSSGTYTAMENTSTGVTIGASYTSSTLDNYYTDRIDSVFITSDVITQSEISGLYSTSVYEIVTPYLTADLPSLDMKQSADVMFIAHPHYEPRRLSRFGDDDWTLKETDIGDGPFRSENSDVTKTITASDTTGSVTLTAVGHSPFVPGTTSGHSPSGLLETSKSITGTLFRLVQGLSAEDQYVSGLLAVGVADVSTATLSVTKGTTWDLVTNGTWGSAADPATVVLERSYDSGTTWETVVSFTSAANYNIVTDDTEDSDDAIYRLTVKEAGGASNMAFNLSVRGSNAIGIVEITSVTSPTVATGTVRKNLSSTDPTHKWSEGEWSNYRGWPRVVDISPEERLTFSGSAARPLTSWGSVSGDFESFEIGTNDDDATIFTLVGSGQQNAIQWQVPRSSMMIGTVGGEHLLGGSSAEEALTPSNVTAKIKGTRGSERLPGMLVNDSILFVQRGGKKVRELSNIDTFDISSYRADDLTVFSSHILESGVVDWAYQRTPDPMLWCVRADGQIAVMMYERQQEVFSWSRVVTNGEYESVTVIYGGEGEEDEVWVTVKREINGSTARYIERFTKRSFSERDDTVMVDSAKVVESTFDSQDIVLASDTVRYGEGLCNSSLCGGVPA